MAKPNFRGTRVGGAGRPRSSNWLAAIHQYWYSGGGQEALYLTGDKCILAPAPGATNDYWAFPCSVGDSEGAKYMVYYQGEGHNQATTHSIQFAKKTAGVWGAAVQVASGSSHTTNPWILKTPTGRLVVGYDRIPDNRIAYVIYSDDDGETWSEEALFEIQQGEGGTMETRNLGGQGDGVVMGDGTLLKAMWEEGVGGPSGYLYKSEDDGETWSKVNNIWVSGVGFRQEPCLCLLPSGRLVCSVRDDTLNTPQIYYLDSLDGAWQGPISSGVASVSKSPVVFAHGMLIMLGRWADGHNGRPMVSFTRDIDNFTGWSDPLQLSERITSIMYGSIIATTTGFQFVYAQGAYQEQTPSISGPTVIIEKDITVSSTVVTESTRYSQGYRSWLDTSQGNAVITPGTSDLRALHNKLIEDLMEDELWDKIVCGLIFQHNDDTLGGFSLFNFRNPHGIARPAATASPAYSVDGYDFNGSTQYINTGFIPSIHGGSVYTLTDAGVYISIKDSVSEGNRADFGASDSAASTITHGPYLNSSNGSAQATFRINDTANTVVNNADSAGRYFLQRINEEANNKALWKNASKLTEATVTATALSSNSVYVGAVHFSNGASLFGVRKVGIILFTSSLTGLEAQLDARIAQYEIDVMNL